MANCNLLLTTGDQFLQTSGDLLTLTTDCTIPDDDAPACANLAVTQPAVCTLTVSTPAAATLAVTAIMGVELVSSEC